MSYEPFLISAFTTGLDTDLQPWILPKDAFQSIVNGYIEHGVLKKRGGTQYFGQMVYDTDPNPQNPIMGIKTFIDTNGTQQLLIFDTKRAAIYDTGTQAFIAVDAADIFNGTESNFISAAAFGKTGSFGTSTLFFTNFAGGIGSPTVQCNPIRTFTTGTTTTQFAPDTTPTLGARNYILGAQFIFSIRQRLLLLNTVEGTALPAGTPPIGTGTNFSQRMRWSRANNPADSGSNWDEVTPGNGGFVDAPTSETIISAKQLQDVIIVYFTNSVWAIEPTADPALPFRWNKINSFRACESPYATIGHDRFSIAYGKRGITACDRVEVKRIDEKIQDFVVDEVNTDFISRMFSERDYTNRRSWTLYPSSTYNLNPATEAETSNRALIRTEEEGSWSIYNVAMVDEDPTNGTNMSCLGYGEIVNDLAYQDLTGDEDISFEEAGNKTWSSYLLQGNSEVFLGGDQIGRVLILEDPQGDDLGSAISFEVTSAGWNPYKEKGIQAQMGYIDFYMDADEDTDYTVEFFCDDINTPYASQNLNCLPNLGFIADIQNVSLTNPVQITAYSHGLATGDQVYIYDLTGSDELTGGPYTLTVVDENNFTLDGIDGTAYTAYGGGGQVVERRFENTKCWKRAYAGAKGYQHYIKITNNGINDVLEFNAFMPWFRPAGNRIIGG